MVVAFANGESVGDTYMGRTACTKQQVSDVACVLRVIGGERRGAQAAGRVSHIRRLSSLTGRRRAAGAGGIGYLELR